MGVNESVYICIYRVYKKKVDKSEIALCFAKRLNVRCFCIKIDCFGTYRINRKNEKFKTSISGGLCLLRQVKYALRKT